MKEQIILALRSLDPLNEQHWTGQGLARVDVVAGLANLPDLKRGDILEAAPSFSRDTVQSYQFDATAVDVSPDTDSPVLTPPASLQAQRDALQAELEDVQRQRFDLQAREADLLGRIDGVDAEMASIIPPPSLADNISTYQRRQNELRETRVRQTDAMVQAGFVSTQKPISALDAALSRGRKRGTNRPEYPKTA
jgi:hypothetical protein